MDVGCYFYFSFGSLYIDLNIFWASLCFNLFNDILFIYLCNLFYKLDTIDHFKLLYEIPMYYIIYACYHSVQILYIFFAPNIFPLFDVKHLYARET